MSLPLIPVLDLRAGRVVHAVRGERDHYAPVRSGLVAGSDPLDVARALLAAAGADRLYVADLDGIIDGRPQAALLAALRAALPGVCLWVDAGFGEVAPARALVERIAAAGAGPAPVPVFGSESMNGARVLRELRTHWPEAVLSLDRRGAQPLDPAGCWQAPSWWPHRVIVMSLDRVGSQAGPDLAQVSAVRQLAPEAELIGAGGVRDAADLAAGAQAGAQAWLVATALHTRRLGQPPDEAPDHSPAG